MTEVEAAIDGMWLALERDPGDVGLRATLSDACEDAGLFSLAEGFRLMSQLGMRPRFKSGEQAGVGAWRWQLCHRHLACYEENFREWWLKAPAPDSQDFDWARLILDNTFPSNRSASEAMALALDPARVWWELVPWPDAQKEADRLAALLDQEPADQASRLRYADFLCCAGQPNHGRGLRELARLGLHPFCRTPQDFDQDGYLPWRWYYEGDGFTSDGRDVLRPFAEAPAHACLPQPVARHMGEHLWAYDTRAHAEEAFANAFSFVTMAARRQPAGESADDEDEWELPF